MFHELNNLLTRTERQLNICKSHTQRDIFNKLSQQPNEKYKSGVLTKEEEKEKLTEPIISTYTIPTYFQTSLLLSSKRSHATNELETRKLIERELEPYINSIKKELEVIINNIRQELKEQTNLLINFKNFKDLSKENQLNIAHLENEIKLIKNNNVTNENSNKNYNDNPNVLVDLNFTKSEISELHKSLNDLKVKYELLKKELNQKDSALFQSQNLVIKDSETKLYRELNILKNQINETNNILHNREDNEKSIVKLREEFNVELNKIKNDIETIKEVDNNLRLTYNKESYEQINKKISMLENQITDYSKLNKNQLPDILNNINNDNIQLKLKVDALTREISDHVFKIQKLEMQQKPSDGIPEIQEAKISIDDIYKIKTDYNSKINKLSDSLNLSLNQLHSFKECQVKDNQIINSRLTNFSKQLEENNEKIKSLQNEIEIFDNNFEKIQSGFNQLERTLQKIEQIENKTNSMEQGMLGFIESIGIIREKMEEQFGGLAEWKKSLLESISENMNNLKNYCDKKLQK